MKAIIIDIFYSFPVQLLILHIRKNLYLISFWIIIFLLLNGNLGKHFGIQYLFLTPEYLSDVGSLSYFILGLGLGVFYIVWNQVTFLLHSYRFPFLATLQRPYTKFSLNNAIVPLLFIIAFICRIIIFLRYEEYQSVRIILLSIISFIVGFVFIVILSAIYFWVANKFKIKVYKNYIQPTLIAPGVAPNQIDTIKQDNIRWRVDNYLTEKFHVRLVRSVAHYERKQLLSVFNQHHKTAFVWQLLIFVLLMFAGYLIEKPMFQIPAAASIFLVAAFFTSILGFISYWLHKWRDITIITLLLFSNLITSKSNFRYENKAFGIDYWMGSNEYSYQKLQEFSNDTYVTQDSLTTIEALNNWRAKFKNKPKLIVIAASGGGLKAALWSAKVMQEINQKTNFDAMKNCMLMTGASGGMIGLSYFRALYYQSLTDQNINPIDTKYLNNISDDLLNPIGFSLITTDLFIPFSKFKYNNILYRKDRGYMFEKQLNINTQSILDKKLGDYKLAELKSNIPMLILSPTIVNDGRRLLISPLGLSYMMSPKGNFQNKNTLQIDAVDFQKLLLPQNANQLRFTTGLRMNATYPYILPNVTLPTQPMMRIMDAGMRDNYGMALGSRFVSVFQDWILSNTSGVVFVQIAGWNKIDSIKSSDKKGWIGNLLNPISIAGQMLSLQDFEADENLGYLSNILGKDMLEILRFTYIPSVPEKRASISFHLSNSEKADVKNAIRSNENQQNLNKLKAILKK